MKKSGTFFLVMLTIVFAILVCCTLFGRNFNHGDVTIQRSTTQGQDIVTSSEETEGANLLDINTATVEQLTELPGIGAILAQRVVTYRQENGPFQSVQELTNVYGIGTQKLLKIFNLITVEE